MKALLFPAHDLPDDTPLEQIRLSTRIRNELEFGGLKTVGEVRAASDVVLLSFQNIGQGSVRHLRETLGPKANQ
jgi:DNA-directed RNA polymerase alpha subunit